MICCVAYIHSGENDEDDLDFYHKRFLERELPSIWKHLVASTNQNQSGILSNFEQQTSNSIKYIKAYLRANLK